MVIAYIFLHFFWFFGINGGSVVGAVFNPILQTLSAENLAALQAGQSIPNIISQQFQDLFATFGGAGSTLSLLIAMLLFCRSKRVKELGKLALVPLCTGIAIPWTMPVIVSGFLATGWQGSVLQALLLILGVFIYMPFIKMMDKQYLADETKTVEADEDGDISLDDLSFDDL